MTEVFHGWFSHEQQKILEKLYVYQTPTGDIVHVTHVSNSLVQTTGFKDITYVGEVIKFMGKIDSHSLKTKI